MSACIAHAVHSPFPRPILAQDGNPAIIGYDSGTAPKVIDLTSAAVTSISNPAEFTSRIAIMPDGNTLFLGDAHVGKIWRVV